MGLKVFITVGKSVALRLIQAGNAVMAALTSMSKEPLRTLGSLLARISGAVFHSPAPPAHVLIKAKRDLYERTGTFAALEGFVAHCFLLDGHRDDCYFATWSAHGVEDHTWEVLDFLSQGDTLTLDNLHNKPSRRGVTDETHAGDMRELIRRGRAEVEAETECLFFTPWSCLDESELGELGSLASQLQDGLKGR
ncbi:MAG: hypothetical protein HND47_12160 [Chloroflexi bacterium]|nr:hypothetical protein [Chloroflexota bacterium]